MNSAGTVNSTDLTAQVHRLIQSHSTEVSKQCVVTGQQGFLLVLTEGRECAGAITVVDGDLGLIESRPHLNSVAKGLEADFCVGFKPLGELGVQESILLKQAQRQIPVVQIHEGSNIAGDQLVDDLIVELDTLGVHLTIAGGDDTAPGQAQTVHILTGLLHILDIFLVIVIEEATTIRQVCGVGVNTTALDATFLQLSFNGRRIDASILAGEVFHNVFRLAVTVNGAFGLEGRVAGADQEIFRESKSVHNIPSCR